MTAVNERPGGLPALEARVRADLAMTAHPRAPWLLPRTGPDGKPALDVLVVGAGQSGLATAFGLLRSQVTHIAVIDRAPAGAEGPWRSYARMPTLRSPKDFTGPDLDVPSLTYQAWHEARYGTAAWDTLVQITRTDWADYLDWFREITGIPVRNGVALRGLAPADGLIAATVETVAGTTTLYARKVVLATGQEGMGDWDLPEPFASLPGALRSRACDPIDFAALAGKVVAVVGAGASAFDNAATALEAGAREVHLLCRRPEAQVVQPYRWLTFRGFLRHLGDLDDAWRWRFMRKILEMREGFPQATYDRCAAQPAFRLHLGAPVSAARAVEGRARLAMPHGSLDADHVIVAAGITMDFAARPELAAFAGNIATWGDRYAPPTDESSERLARFPYLGADYALSERTPGVTPWIADVHVFSIASTMSFGASGSSINAMTTAVPRLVSGITRGLFAGDVERHWRDLLAYDVPQAVLHSSSQA